MKAKRRTFPRVTLVLCMAAAMGFLGLGVGCSEDDIVGDATAEAVEAGLNEVLAGTVRPLFELFSVISDLIPTPPVAQSSLGVGLTCPESSSVCQTGSFTCDDSSGVSLNFNFSQCVVATGDAPLTLSGGLLVTPGFGARGLGGAPINLTLQGLVINGSSPMTGTGVVDDPGCTYDINVSSDDALVNGTIIECDTDDYPTAASDLSISLNDVLLAVIFNGSATATATATSEGSLVANCSINLDSLASSCSAP